MDDPTMYSDTTSSNVHDTNIKRFGKYVVKRQLGKGAMGEVYLASNPDLNQQVAIKTILYGNQNNTLSNNDGRFRFKQEARHLAQVRHANVISIFDLVDDTDQPYIVMEYLEGVTIADMIQDSATLSESQKKHMIRQLCLGLQAIHQVGIIHRDIKPSNIFLTKDNVIKIFDFGIAKGEQSYLTKSGEIIGTINYMSPEQIRGESVDKRSDIFSLGALFYELITYRRAFAGNSITNAMYQILNDTPKSIKSSCPSYSYHWDALIQQCLAKDPSNRFQDVSELLLSLDKIQTDQNPEQLLPLAASASNITKTHDHVPSIIASATKSLYRSPFNDSHVMWVLGILSLGISYPVLSYIWFQRYAQNILDKCSSHQEESHLWSELKTLYLDRRGHGFWFLLAVSCYVEGYLFIVFFFYKMSFKSFRTLNDALNFISGVKQFVAFDSLFISISAIAIIGWMWKIGSVLTRFHESARSTAQNSLSELNRDDHFIKMSFGWIFEIGFMMAGISCVIYALLDGVLKIQVRNLDVLALGIIIPLMLINAMAIFQMRLKQILIYSFFSREIEIKSMVIFGVHYSLLIAQILLVPVYANWNSFVRFFHNL